VLLRRDGKSIDVPTITTRDGAKMILIPAGEFIMGSKSVEYNPPHKVYVDAFYIDIHEVTVGQYEPLRSLRYMDSSGNGNTLISSEAFDIIPGDKRLTVWGGIKRKP